MQYWVFAQSRCTSHTPVAFVLCASAKQTARAKVVCMMQCILLSQECGKTAAWRDDSGTDTSSGASATRP